MNIAQETTQKAINAINQIADECPQDIAADRILNDWLWREYADFVDADGCKALIKEHYRPDHIFSQEDLEEWATDNGFVKGGE